MELFTICTSNYMTTGNGQYPYVLVQCYDGKKQMRLLLTNKDPLKTLAKLPEVPEYSQHAPLGQHTTCATFVRSHTRGRRTQQIQVV